MDAQHQTLDSSLLTQIAIMHGFTAMYFSILESVSMVDRLQNMSITDMFRITSLTEEEWSAKDAERKFKRFERDGYDVSLSISDLSAQ